ncbi:MAG TPA: GTPase, partial [Actinomycetota bacterium]|nr:GTPase [Actinomycetota bacterium]
MKGFPRRQTGPSLEQRLEALRRVVDIARDRFDPGLVDEARGLLERGAERMKLGADVTVAALAGATGSGKSSLFNRLCGQDLATVGVRRPTTSAAQAATWGDASEVLDWLGVSRRHGLEDPALQGLVLLDLPDTDSTQVEHRLEADRLVQLVDVFIWVVDPQKYADAVLHEGYLRPLAGHAPVSVVVLNQVDKLSEADRRACIADLNRLLKEDGLSGVKVLSTSTTSGEGIAGLRDTVEARVREERAAVQRLSADLDRLAERMAGHCGPEAPGLGNRQREVLVDALAEAAGAGTVADAVASSHRRDAALAVGWPFSRWVKRFRPDPLGRLHLRRSGEGGRTSLPGITPLQRAQVDMALREAATSAANGLPEPWPACLKKAVGTAEGDLEARLDTAVSSTDLGEDRRPAWWTVAGGVQTLLAAIAVLGFAWLTLLFALEWLGIPRPPTPQYEGIPWPTIALLGGLLVGLVLAFLFRQLARLGARRRRRRAAERLRKSVLQVAEDRVLQPLDRELGAYS